MMNDLPIKPNLITIEEITEDGVSKPITWSTYKMSRRINYGIPSVFTPDEAQIAKVLDAMLESSIVSGRPEPVTKTEPTEPIEVSDHALSANNLKAMLAKYQRPAPFVGFCHPRTALQMSRDLRKKGMMMVRIRKGMWAAADRQHPYDKLGEINLSLFASDDGNLYIPKQPDWNFRRSVWGYRR